jgi:hypothetical protein
MGKAQENQMRLKSNETNQLTVNSDYTYLFGKHIYHKEKTGFFIS